MAALAGVGAGYGYLGLIVADYLDPFRALSDTCPHLGCKVHWQPATNRFFCPSHGTKSMGFTRVVTGRLRPRA